jgi:hypothetical protein
MPYWLEHRFIAHLHELDGDFTSPVTNETMALTDLHKALALATLLCLPYDPDKQDPLKFGHRAQFPISRKVIGLMFGKPVTEDTYANWVKAMTRAGVFVFTINEPYGNYSIEAGLALDCARYGDRGLCDPETHNPYWFKPPKVNQATPSVEQSTPSVEPIPEPGLPEESPPIHLDINKENKPEQGGTSENTKELESETLENLPSNYQKWAWIISGLKGLGQPSSLDIIEAWRCYKRTGVDLEPGGLWLDGRQNPLTGSKHN